MFPNSMTGDPNQQNQSSIFGYEVYPPQNALPFNWPDYRTTQQFPSPHTYQFNSANAMQTPQTALTTFSFNSERPNQPIVQFPFQIGSSFGVNTHTLRCKRKTDSPPPQPCKQHITEEKMAEHMSKLHISSETASTSKEDSDIREQRLYMCEEMRKLKSDAILPQCLLDKMQRPCTALVLWQPPPRILEMVPNENDDNSENNNEENIPDQHNQMENDDSIEIDPTLAMDM